MLKKFYHYTDFEGASKIIKNNTIKCNSPYNLNDPFDTKFKIDLESNIEEIADFFIRKFNLQALEENKDSIRYKRAKKKAAQYLQKKLEIESEDWLNYIKKLRVFCLSEVKNNLLMWAHYSDRHKGAVIEFKCIPNCDCPFCEASKIQYKKTKPNIGSVQELINGDIDYQEIKDKFLFTKSTEWSYEKEWRLIFKQCNGNKDYDLRKVSSRYITGVYLGFKMSKENKKKIAELGNEINGVDFYEATLNGNEKFEINFDEYKIGKKK